MPDRIDHAAEAQRECRTTWQTRRQTFMGVSTITKWCTCDGYEPIEEKS